MIIDNLNIGRAAIGPDKADAELIVDANAVLTHPFTFERLQPITRRRAQKIQCLGGIELRQLAFRYGLDRSESSGTAALEQSLGIGASEGLDHQQNVLRLA